MKRILFATMVLLCTAATGSAQDIPLSKILVQGEGWVLAKKEVRGIQYVGGNSDGSIFVLGADIAGSLFPDGKFVEDPKPKPPASRFYPGAANHVILTSRIYYCIDKENRTLECRVEEKNEQKKLENVKLEALDQPTCLTLWPDKSQLVIGDAGGNYLWTARIEKDGKLGKPDRYYSLRVKPEAKGSGVKAMVMDAGNLLYAATPLSVQVFDPTGRLCGVISAPAKEEMTALTIGGKDADTLYVACGDKIYSRKTHGKAAYTLKKDK